jgi:predicted DNA-binding transcriptional regulator AlpA
MPAPDDLLYTNEVAEQYGLNAATMRYWRSADQGPACFTLGPRGRVVYRRSEIERWLAEMEQTTRKGGHSGGAQSTTKTRLVRPRRARRHE